MEMNVIFSCKYYLLVQKEIRVCENLNKAKALLC